MANFDESGLGLPSVKTAFRNIASRPLRGTRTDAFLGKKQCSSRCINLRFELSIVVSRIVHTHRRCYIQHLRQARIVARSHRQALVWSDRLVEPRGHFLPGPGMPSVKTCVFLETLSRPMSYERNAHHCDKLRHKISRQTHD